MPSTLCEKFKALWDSTGNPPDVFAFLENHVGSESAAKLAVVRCDQELRWKAGQPLKVEEYLARLPELAANSDCKLQLAVGEFHACQSLSTPPSIDDFVTRFPDISDTLRKIMSGVATEAHPKPMVSETQTFDLHDILPDQRIGRYRLVRILGEGAFGRVWLGFDDELERQVAIKVPKPERFQSSEDAESFLAEARTVVTLNHPNIVPVYDVGRTDDGSIYVVSKYIEGSTLGDRIKQNRPTFDESAILLALVAQALHQAHQKRIIHRDIKPANLLIEEATNLTFRTTRGGFLWGFPLTY